MKFIVNDYRFTTGIDFSYMGITVEPQFVSLVKVFVGGRTRPTYVCQWNDGILSPSNDLKNNAKQHDFCLPDWQNLSSNALH
jgi:hypothetical protein